MVPGAHKIANLEADTRLIVRIRVNARIDEQGRRIPVSDAHLRAHETTAHPFFRLWL